MAALTVNNIGLRAFCCTLQADFHVERGCGRAGTSQV